MCEPASIPAAHTGKDLECDERESYIRRYRAMELLMSTSSPVAVSQCEKDESTERDSGQNVLCRVWPKKVLASTELGYGRGACFDSPRRFRPERCTAHML